MTARMLKADWIRECARILRIHGFLPEHAREYAGALWLSVSRTDGVFYEKGAQMTPADAVASDAESWEE
jgi:hypothetical protein